MWKFQTRKDVLHVHKNDLGHVEPHCQRFWWMDTINQMGVCFRNTSRWLWYRRYTYFIEKNQFRVSGTSPVEWFWISYLNGIWMLAPIQIWFGELGVLELYLYLESYGALYTHYVSKDISKSTRNIFNFHVFSRGIRGEPIPVFSSFWCLLTFLGLWPHHLNLYWHCQIVCSSSVSDGPLCPSHRDTYDYI